MFTNAPESLRRLFSRPSLMNGEDAAVYAELYAQVEEIAQPRNVRDQMMVSDVVNHFWEQQRYRHCTGTIINVNRREALKIILEHGIGLNPADTHALLDIYFDVKRCGEMTLNLIHPRPAKIPNTRQGVITFLKAHGFDEADIDGLAMERSVDTLAELQNLALKHELRREAILRELESRQERRRQPPPGREKLKGKVRALAKDLPDGPSPLVAKS
jgi:hypothetical protein